MGNKMLIAAHDAGGAEIVSSWVRQRLGSEKFYFCVDGPAVKVFSRKIADFTNIPFSKLEEVLPKVNTLLMGTSWHSDLERLILQRATEMRKKTIAFLDHWSNYEIRFRLENRMFLPNEIWVGDEHALKLAQDCFPGHSFKLIPNPYLEDILQSLKDFPIPIKQEEATNILYVCEPSSSIYGYSEWYALENYLSYLFNDVHVNWRLKVRLHPSESRNKYDHILEKFKGRGEITLSDEPDVARDCYEADWVVGCQTFAMIIALKLGKKVFSCIPSGGKPCLLPCRKIINLFNLSETASLI